jgi:hypothetical protein
MIKTWRFSLSCSNIRTRKHSILYQELVKKQIALQANALASYQNYQVNSHSRLPLPGKSLASMYYALTNALEAFEKEAF